jgi:uncharacterized protein
MPISRDSPVSPAYVVDASRSPFARLRPVPIDAVHLADDFLEPRRRINRETTLLSQYAHLEETGCLNNFRRVADPTMDTPYRGFYFADTDLYKWLEAAATALLDAGPHTKRLRECIAEGIALIEGAQREDGYLDTYYERERVGDRFTNLRDMHEMYCAGHFIQAAVAHYRATGSDRLLNVARRVADNLEATFGPAESGKTPGTDGHPEIEMALVELYRATDEKRYLDFAHYLVGARGQVPSACYNRNRPADTEKGTAYHQDHVPYRELGEVTGHAVRMLYLAAGAIDLYLETGEAALKDAIDRQWKNFTTRRMYVSGGAGARYEGEAFGKDYELPAERAYTETCAAIASVMWNYRLLLATGEARYADLLEWTLYNAVLPGLSLDGEHYFYQNPLSDDGTHRRKPWFGCACCPPNVARLLAQLPGYFYAVSDDMVWMNLYASGDATVPLPDGRTVELSVRTRYPWDGDVKITVRTAGEFGIALRAPSWCESGATLTVNGEAAPVPQPGDFGELRREWQAGDGIHLHLPMPVRALEAHPYLTDAANRIALTRGPLLYCIEGADHSSHDVRDLSVPYGADGLPDMEPVTLDSLPGVVALRGDALEESGDAAAWGETLYRRIRLEEEPGELGPAVMTAIPYCVWANRAPGRMEVWLR